MKQRLRHDESGLVSMTVTSILILVITITVMAFAQMVRTEQRQALDAQLSSQAFYAAESGVNAARAYIEDTFLNAGLTVPEKTECGSTQAAYEGLSTEIDSETSTGFSCLLITDTPRSLEYDLSQPNSSVVFPIESTAALSSVNFSWTPEDGASNAHAACPASLASNPALPTADAWGACGYALLRVDLVPMSGTASQAELMGATYTAFMHPTRSGGTSNYTGSGVTNINGGTANQGTRPSAHCTATACNLRVNNLSDTKYYARVMNLYRGTKLTVTARTTGSTNEQLRGAQVMIDSTGKSQDILRRIQVRVPLVGGGTYPDYAIMSTDSLCKQFKTFPGYDKRTPECDED